MNAAELEPRQPPSTDVQALSALYAQGRFQDMVQCAQRMVATYPAYPLGWKALGIAQQTTGRTPDAIASMQQLLLLTPDDAEGHNNLAAILLEAGRHLEAYKHGLRALHARPDFPEALNNLSVAYRELGQLDHARTCGEKAIQLVPTYAEAHFNVGNVYQEQGRYALAQGAYEQAVRLKPDFAAAINHLALLLAGQGQAAQALPLFERALQLEPQLLTARQGLNAVQSRLVPGWHVAMMNEGQRNDAYYAAIKAATVPGQTRVFEIGTGSGLLAMMAAKLGSQQVATCEAEPIIAHTASAIVADNGLQHVVKVLAKPSTQVEIGTDMDAQADVLLTEIFSSELLGEHVLPSIEDAKARLLKPGGTTIPMAGSIMIALVGGESLRRNLMVDDTYGLKLQRFNNIVKRKWSLTRQDLDIELLSKDAEAFRFDFANQSYFAPEDKLLRLTASSPGRCLGVIQWIKLQLDANNCYENHPHQKSDVANWQQCVYLFPEPLEVKAGSHVVLRTSHDRKVP